MNPFRISKDKQSSTFGNFLKGNVEFIAEGMIKNLFSKHTFMLDNGTIIRIKKSNYVRLQSISNLLSSQRHFEIIAPEEKVELISGSISSSYIKNMSVAEFHEYRRPKRPEYEIQNELIKDISSYLDELDSESEMRKYIEENDEMFPDLEIIITYFNQLGLHNRIRIAEVEKLTDPKIKNLIDQTLEILQKKFDAEANLFRASATTDDNRKRTLTFGIEVGRYICSDTEE